jgi:hypothetical protein
MVLESRIYLGLLHPQLYPTISTLRCDWDSLSFLQKMEGSRQELLDPQ